MEYPDGKNTLYSVKGDKSGYEDKRLTFVSIDNGLTWNLE